jgi:pimeloyl-ACP methyl ester carboxylesterase
MAKAYAELPNEVVRAANGLEYAYRDTGGGDGAVPLVLLQHFRGNLDNWDPDTMEQMARDGAGRSRRPGLAGDPDQSELAGRRRS